MHDRKTGKNFSRFEDEIVEDSIFDVRKEDFEKKPGAYDCHDISEYVGMCFISKNNHIYSISLIYGIKRKVDNAIKESILQSAKRTGKILEEFRNLAREHYAIKGLDVEKGNILEVECMAGVDADVQDVALRYIEDFRKGATSNLETFIKKYGRHIKEGDIILGVVKEAGNKRAFITEQINTIFGKKKKGKKEDEEDYELLE